jgi:hypothetical protein
VAYFHETAEHYLTGTGYSTQYSTLPVTVRPGYPFLAEMREAE